MKIFVAAPFGNYIEETGNFNIFFQEKLQKLYEFINSLGHEYFSAHENENWGHSPLSPEDCVPIDFRELISADLIIALLGNPPSIGVVLELGWASALKKPIILVGTQINSSSMIAGLNKVSNVIYLEYDLDCYTKFSDNDLLLTRRILKYIEDFDYSDEFNKQAKF